MTVIAYGDDNVPVHVKPWRAAGGVTGYRKTYQLRPGEFWDDAPISNEQYEHLALVNGRAIPVGIAIAAELVRDGAEWAYCTEMWGGFTDSYAAAA